jgi:hypothetical protein
VQRDPLADLVAGAPVTTALAIAAGLGLALGLALALVLRRSRRELVLAEISRTLKEARP